MSPEKYSNQNYTPETQESEPISNKRLGAKILSLFKKNSEKSPSNNYLLSEQVQNPLESRFGNKWWKGVCETWDKKVNIDMPMELGRMIESYVSDPNYQFGVHRSNAIDGAEYETDEILQSIMENGLMNLGDASSGAFRKDPSLEKTVSFCDNMLNAIINIKGSYKGSTGAILVAVPSEYLTQSHRAVPGHENTIYNHNNAGYSYLKPEFILGFVQNLGQNSTLKFTSRQELLSNYRKNHP